MSFRSGVGDEYPTWVKVPGLIPEDDGEV